MPERSKAMQGDALSQTTLVAGGTGYLGRHLVRELAGRGIRVRALVRRVEQQALVPEAAEVVVGQVTQPVTLSGVCDGVTTVYSALGATRPSSGGGYDEVDYRGNLALLREAGAAGVGRFGYVSVLHGDRLRTSVPLAAAKERFVAALVASPVAHTIIRPTGFFSDMSAYLQMARRGRVILVGRGTASINPVSGADVARACVDAVTGGQAAIAVGGPEVFTHAQIADLVATVVGGGVHTVHVPPAVARAVVAAARIAPERLSGPLTFLYAVLTQDMVGPRSGADRLVDYFTDELGRAPFRDRRRPGPADRR